MKAFNCPKCYSAAATTSIGAMYVRHTETPCAGLIIRYRKCTNPDCGFTIVTEERRRFPKHHVIDGKDSNTGAGSQQ